jgi:hypothetical protein
MKNVAVLQVITEAITPYIGAMMARSSVEVHCKRLGIDGDQNVTSSQINELLKNLALGLNIFIGREKADSLIANIKTSLGEVAQ